ncbi:MAG: hypothetical protein IV101_21285 [Dechloromonas sp.]|nr:hypothetical protein [Dechloromonas sp.]
MSRHQFYEVKRVAVSSLLLDTYNPRIRHGQDQKDCIARILRDRDNFLSLMKDIAANGLSIEHVVVSKNHSGKWVVRDGNRRITALKLLNRPSLALPDTALVSLITRIREAHAENIPSKIQCMACDDEETISSFLKRKHTGANAGIGQKSWSAVLIALFNLHAGIADQNRRAAQLLLWAEENGMQINDEFPITTLTRGLSAETLQLIGFKIEDDDIVPVVSIEKAYAMVERVIIDIAQGRIHVKRDGEEGSIFTKENQRKYFRSVRDAFADQPDEPVPPASQPMPALPADRPPHEPTGGSPVDAPQDNSATRPARRQASPAKPAWDRPCLFGRRKGAAPGFIIPDSEPKAISVTVELRGINPRDTPIAAAMLLRYLIELSNAYYRQAHSLRQLDTMRKSIANSAEHMKGAGLLSQDEIDVILRYTREEQSMLHINTLQAYIHRPNFHPNGQAINTFWDEIGCFVAACWA